MSQIQSFLESAGPGPGPVLSLTGDSGGAVAPNGAGTIFVDGEDNPGLAIMAQTEGGLEANHLSILPYSFDSTTIGAVTNTIYSLAIPNNFVATVRARIVAQNTTFTACAGGDIIVVGRNPGGTGVVATSGGSGIVTDYVGNPPPTVIGTASGNNLIIQVTGVTGQTWLWTAAIMYTFQY